MGTRDSTAPPVPTALAAALFTPVQQRVLGLLFGQPERRYQSAELIRLAESGTGAVHRFLGKLAESGLARVNVDGRQKYYQANPDCPIFDELVGLVGKTVGLAEPLRAALLHMASEIHEAFVYGSVAAREDHAGSDIDIMVVSDTLDYQALFEALQVVEKRLGGHVNATLMTAAEWQAKLDKPDGFASRVSGRPSIRLLGTDDHLA